MYAPVFFPPAPPPSPAVLAREREILEREGPYHVDGIYYRNPFDAERQRLDLVNDGSIQVVHRSSLAAVRDELARGTADAVLVSVALLQPGHAVDLAALIRGFPAHPVIGLVIDAPESHANHAVAQLGNAGVQQVIDARGATGWALLRRALAALRWPDAFLVHALEMVLREIVTGGEAPIAEGCVRFFRAVFLSPLTRAGSGGRSGTGSSATPTARPGSKRSTGVRW